MKSKRSKRWYFPDNLEHGSGPGTSNSTSHPRKKKKPTLCEFCGKLLYNNTTKHRLIHTGERPFLCEYCGKGFIEASHVPRHKLKYHADLVSQSKGSSAMIEPKEGKHVFNPDAQRDQHSFAQKRPLPSCEDGGETLGSLAHSKRYKLSHEEKIPCLGCESCSQIFDKESNLNEQTTMDSKKSKPMYVTDKVEHGSGPGTSNATSRPRKKKNTTLCEFCGKSTNSRNAYKHRLIHTGEWPFLCEYCGKGFIQAPRVEQHKLKVHADLVSQTKGSNCSAMIGRWESPALEYNIHPRRHTTTESKKSKPLHVQVPDNLEQSSGPGVVPNADGVTPIAEDVIANAEGAVGNSKGAIAGLSLTNNVSLGNACASQGASKADSQMDLENFRGEVKALFTDVSSQLNQLNNKLDTMMSKVCTLEKAMSAIQTLPSDKVFVFKQEDD